VVHEGNTWGITLEDSSDNIFQEPVKEAKKSELPEGLQFHFDISEKKPNPEDIVSTSGQSIEELRAALKNLKH